MVIIVLTQGLKKQCFEAPTEPKVRDSNSLRCTKNTYSLVTVGVFLLPLRSSELRQRRIFADQRVALVPKDAQDRVRYSLLRFVNQLEHKRKLVPKKTHNARYHYSLRIIIL